MIKRYIGQQFSRSRKERHDEKIKTQKENYEAMLEKIQGDSADLSSEEEEETSLTEKFEAFKEKEGFALSEGGI